MSVFSARIAGVFALSARPVAALATAAALLSGCPQPPAVTRARARRELESTDKQVVLAAAAPVVTFATCSLTPDDAAPAPTPGSDGAPAFERGALSLGTNGARWVGFFQRSARAMGALGADPNSEHRWPLDAASLIEAGAPSVVALDDGSALVVGVVHERAGRAHRVGAVPRAGGTAPVRPLFRHPEPSDDGFAIAATATSAGGALIAWDEEGPAGGVIVGHFVRPPAATDADGAAPSGSPERAGPASATWSDPSHDAADPVLVRAIGEGPRGAFLLYLAGRDVDSETATQSATQSSADIYVRPLDPRGVPLANAVRITPSPSLRFGVTALARADALWVAYRVSNEADHQSSGDGGSVAVIRVAPDGSRPLGEGRVHSLRESVPTGTPALLDDGPRGVVLVWAERRGDGSVTVRRALSPDGSPRGPARDEPAFAGEIPTAGPASAPWFVRAGADGRPAMARARCPDV